MFKRLTVADIATCVLVVIAAFAVYRWQIAPQTPKGPEPEYQVGQTIKEIKTPITKTTLVMVTSSGCPHCVNTLPAYRTLLTAARAQGLRVLAVAGEDVTKHREWLATNGIVPDEIMEGRSTGLKIRGTPTTMVIGASNRVRAFEVGEITSDMATRIRAAF